MRNERCAMKGYARRLCTFKANRHCGGVIVRGNRAAAGHPLPCAAMGRKTLRRPNRNESSRPSTFFLIALAAGIVMLIVMAVVFIRTPMKPEPPQKRGAVVITGQIRRV